MGTLVRSLELSHSHGWVLLICHHLDKDVCVLSPFSLHPCFGWSLKLPHVLGFGGASVGIVHPSRWRCWTRPKTGPFWLCGERGSQLVQDKLPASFAWYTLGILPRLNASLACSSIRAANQHISYTEIFQIEPVSSTLPVTHITLITVSWLSTSLKSSNVKASILTHCSVLSEPYQYLKTRDHIPHPLRNSSIAVL